MNYKEKLITKYQHKIKEKKSFKNFCLYIENELHGKKISFDLCSDIMQAMFCYNVDMYKKTHNISIKNDDLNICIYIIPNKGTGKKYYNEEYIYSSIKGYRKFIYVLLIEQLEYYMESNSGILFINLAIERGISNKEKDKKSILYIEYLSRIEAKENNYYKYGYLPDTTI